MNQPVLSGAQLGRAFPFFLWLDTHLHLRQWGPGLGKLMPGLAEGQALTDAFVIKRPVQHATLEHWQRHGHDLCTLETLDGSSLRLRGSAEFQPDGSLLLLVSPVVTSMAGLKRLGLELNDFARHDAVGELLLVGRTMQMSAEDASRMAARSKARQAQIEAMLELCDAGVAYFDAEDRLRYQNQLINTLMGYMPGEALGLSLERFEERLVGLLAPGEMQRHPLSDLLVAEGAGERDASMVLRRERPHYAVMELALRRSDDGGHVVFLRDITRETEAERMKSDFLSSAAHELRTPMASILGYTELLLHRPLSEERRHEALQTVHRQSQLLMRIVNELLDLARIEARQGRDMDRRPTSVQRLLDQLKQAQDDQPRTHRMAWPVEVPERLLLVDEIKTVQALSEVLDNARQFSPEGAPVTLSITSDDEQWLTLEVRDQGIGMTAEACAHVCDRFWRADPSRHDPGTGLGMALVKEIIDLQGGWLDIHSEPGQGTAVRMTLPVVTVALEAPAMDHNSAIDTLGATPLDAPHPR